jgi:hypothetical protein
MVQKKFPFYILEIASFVQPKPLHLLQLHQQIQHVFKFKSNFFYIIHMRAKDKDIYTSGEPGGCDAIERDLCNALST